MLPLFLDLEIFAAKRNDFGRRLLPRRPHEPVGVKPAARDDKFRAKIAGRRFDDAFAGVRNYFSNARVEPDFAAAPADEFAELFADAGIIHDAFLRHVDRREAGGVRLDFLDLFRVQVFASPAARWRCRGSQRFSKRGNSSSEVATTILPQISWAMPCSRQKADHLLQARDAQFRLLRAGLVIKPGMQHAAVIAGLMRGEFGFFFEEQNFQAAASSPKAGTPWPARQCRRRQ